MNGTVTVTLHVAMLMSVQLPIVLMEEYLMHGSGGILSALFWFVFSSARFLQELFVCRMKEIEVHIECQQITTTGFQWIPTMIGLRLREKPMNSKPKGKERLLKILIITCLVLVKCHL